MEHTCEKIKSLISKIIFLLEIGDGDYWLKYFKYTLEQINRGNDRKIIISIRESFMGGMGSFSDFLLYKNGNPLIEENNQLDILKDKLFDECEEFLRGVEKN